MSIRVTITNSSSTNTLVIQEASGYPVFSAKLAGSAVKVVDLDTATYERLRPVLVRMAGLSKLTWSATGENVSIHSIVDPAAKTTNTVHAAVAANAANAFPGPITAPAIPRNVRAVFAASYDGGDITVVGTNQYGAAVTEVIADAAGTTVEGVKIFKTITSISKETVGATANTVSIGFGDKMGVVGDVANAKSFVMTVDGVAENATVDATYDAFTPTTVPNAARDYVLIVGA